MFRAGLARRAEAAFYQRRRGLGLASRLFLDWRCGIRLLVVHRPLAVADTATERSSNLHPCTAPNHATRTLASRALSIYTNA